jgi:hypothetical protein
LACDFPKGRPDRDGKFGGKFGNYKTLIVSSPPAWTRDHAEPGGKELRHRGARIQKSGISKCQKRGLFFSLVQQHALLVAIPHALHARDVLSPADPSKGGQLR